jgi:hypothetical protein
MCYHLFFPERVKGKEQINSVWKNNENNSEYYYLFLGRFLPL